MDIKMKCTNFMGTDGDLNFTVYMGQRAEVQKWSPDKVNNYP